MQELLQSLLWQNDYQKLFFSQHKCPNTDRHYLFTLDIRTGRRNHGYYYTDKELIVEINNVKHEIKELKSMEKYGFTMIQLTALDNPNHYNNWQGVEIPSIKGKPYVINDQYPLLH